jgi:uncharacterized protein YndB with AHSA1/START domain
MTTETVELSRLLPATPDRIYLAWLNGPDHTAMTGGRATVANTEVGGGFTAWDGFIDGVHVALEPGRRIVQAWRTDEFPADATESHVEVLLELAPGGTLVTIRHTGIPEGLGPGYLIGWEEDYLVPMTRFFAREARGRAGTRRKAPVRKAPPKRPAARKAAVRKPAAREPAPRRNAKKAPARRR